MEGKLSRGAPRFNVTPDMVVAFDFETMYDSKAHYSLRNMTPYDYVHDPRFDAYLVAFTSEDGQRFVGAPEAFDWSSLAGAHLIAHNAAFDGMVLNRLFELGKVARFEYALDCTADMVAFFCIPRSLKDACKHLLGRTLSKKVRAEMDGKTLRDLSPAAREELIVYGGSDADNCLDLWKAKSAEWPEIEREISRIGRESGWRGVRVDRAALQKGIAALKNVQAAAVANLPWVNRLNPDKGAKAGSTAAFASHCMRIGLPVPKCLNKTDPGYQAWIERYRDKYPFIQARLDAASIPSHMKRLEAMLHLADHEDVIRFSSLYFGSHTGRYSGGSDAETSGGAKVNIYNQPKGEPGTGLTHGVDMRGMIIPRPGYVFSIWDFSQIESRCVQWMSGNTAFLDLIRKIGNIYEADAVQSGLWDPARGGLKKADPRLYSSSKQRVLGLGFSMSCVKFLLTCKKARVDIGYVPKAEWNLDRRMKFIIRNQTALHWDRSEDEEEISRLLMADRLVMGWRAANPRIADRETGLWAWMQSQLETAAANGEATHTFTLPSGRKKTYYNPHFKFDSHVKIDPETGVASSVPRKVLMAESVKGFAEAFHGGKITENIIQATARDILFWGVVDVLRAKPNWFFPFNVYDEGVFEVPIAEAELSEKLIPDCLCRGSASSWTQGLPLEVDGGIRDRYEK